MKRGREATESDDLGPNKKTKRRQVSLTTFKKWQAQLEREHQTMMWLRCDTDKSNPSVVDTLWGSQVQSLHYVGLLQRHPQILQKTHLALMTGMTFLIQTNHHHIHAYPMPHASYYYYYC